MDNMISLLQTAGYLTLLDIAALAGVTRPTLNRFRDGTKIKEAKRVQVERALKMIKLAVQYGELPLPDIVNETQEDRVGRLRQACNAAIVKYRAKEPFVTALDKLQGVDLDQPADD